MWGVGIPLNLDLKKIIEIIVGTKKIQTYRLVLAINGKLFLQKGSF